MNNYIEVNNEKLKVLLLFNYKERDFIIYELENGDISASIIKTFHNTIELEKITSEEDWNYVEKMLEASQNEK